VQYAAQNIKTGSLEARAWTQNRLNTVIICWCHILKLCLSMCRIYMPLLTVLCLKWWTL